VNSSRSSYSIPASLALRRAPLVTNGQRGFNLIELLIAMALGLFLIGGVFRVYESNIAAYRWVNAHSKLQENFRFAVDTLRRAGHYVLASRVEKCPVTINKATTNVAIGNDAGQPACIIDKERRAGATLGFGHGA